MTDLGEIRCRGFSALMPLSNSEFREIRCGGSHFLAEDINEVLPIFSAFSERFGSNSVQEMSTKSSWAVMIFLKIDALKASLYLEA